MSREAMEAAQDNSGIDDPFGLHILVTIGRFIAHDTKVGWCSDRTIADIAKVDKDSVGRWRERFTELGAVESWTTGAGRGTKTWYKFLFEFDTTKYKSVIGDNNEEMSLSSGDNNDGDIKLLLSRVDKLLSLFEKIMSPECEEMSPSIVPNVPTRKGQEHHSTNESPLGTPDGSPPRARKPINSELPPEVLPHFEGDLELVQMISAIDSQVREIYTEGVNDKDFRKIAKALVKRKENPEHVRGFNSWWQGGGSWYGNTGKASLMHFFGAWDDYMSGVKTKPTTPGRNGHTPSGETVEDILSNLEVADGFAGFS